MHLRHPVHIRQSMIFNSNIVNNKFNYQSLVNKQFLETLFLAIKMCTESTADVIWINTMCAVSLPNHLRAVAKGLWPL